MKIKCVIILMVKEKDDDTGQPQIFSSKLLYCRAQQDVFKAMHMCSNKLITSTCIKIFFTKFKVYIGLGIDMPIMLLDAIKRY